MAVVGAVHTGSGRSGLKNSIFSLDAQQQVGHSSMGSSLGHSSGTEGKSILNGCQWQGIYREFWGMPMGRREWLLDRGSC